MAGIHEQLGPAKYETTNWSPYNDALKQRELLAIWFDPEMVWTPPPTIRRGRQSKFSDTGIQTVLTMNVLFSMPERQTAGFVDSLLRLVGLDWSMPRDTWVARCGNDEAGHHRPRRIETRTC